MPSKLRSHVGHIAVFIVVGATAMTERFGAPRPLWGALRLIIAATFAVPGLVALCLALRAAPATAAFPGQSGPIAFESTRDGNFEIYAMDADGENQTNLTNNAAGDFEPAFSPDGTKIAFTSAPRRQRRGLRHGRQRPEPDQPHQQRGDRPRAGLLPRRHQDRLHERPRRQCRGLRHGRQRPEPDQPHRQRRHR